MSPTRAGLATGVRAPAGNPASSLGQRCRVEGDTFTCPIFRTHTYSAFRDAVSTLPNLNQAAQPRMGLRVALPVRRTPGAITVERARRVQYDRAL